ncbi:hypothetical protein DHL47_04950 [Streptococcus panodentis]|uniref:Uncharacterized protein n=1 Tax=Streptococcus panodentis TaxID=1581472 RepID=A0ABS5AVV4_9STRE|nr:hypothetical protein [Streptococcus panodentis]
MDAQPLVGVGTELLTNPVPRTQIRYSTASQPSREFFLTVSCGVAEKENAFLQIGSRMQTIASKPALL